MLPGTWIVPEIVISTTRLTAPLPESVSGLFYNGARIQSVVSEDQNYVAVQSGGDVTSGVGGSASGGIGGGLFLEWLDWNDIVLVDSFLMPEFESVDESCPDTTVLIPEACGAQNDTILVGEQAVIVDAAANVVGIIDEASATMTVTEESC